MASFTPNPETLHNIEYHQTNAIGIFKYFANENFDQECHGSNWTVEHNHFHASNNHSMAMITKSANPHSGKVWIRITNLLIILPKQTTVKKYIEAAKHKQFK